MPRGVDVRLHMIASKAGLRARSNDLRGVICPDSRVTGNVLPNPQFEN